MFDTAESLPQADAALLVSGAPSAHASFAAAHTIHYRVSKRVFDLLVAFILLLPLLLAALALLVVNPFCNKGRLFYVQERMGQNCRPFRVWKFRSMTDVPEVERGPFDALEVDRITSLGRLLRRTRVDELPQLFNVLKGEMSLIGPRPDYYPHAVEYLAQLPGYRERHAVKPGISGYAQTEVGYVDRHDAVTAKVAADLYYVRHASLPLDLWIAWRTLSVVMGRQGA